MCMSKLCTPHFIDDVVIFVVVVAVIFRIDRTHFLALSNHPLKQMDSTSIIYYLYVHFSFSRYCSFIALRPSHKCTGVCVCVSIDLCMCICDKTKYFVRIKIYFSLFFIYFIIWILVAHCGICVCVFTASIHIRLSSIETRMFLPDLWTGKCMFIN